MIAAVRRRRMVARVRLESWTRAVDRAGNRVLAGEPRTGRWTRVVDGRANAALVGLWPRVDRAARPVRRGAASAWRRLRPLVVALLRGLHRVERVLLAVVAAWRRAATRASAVLTPARAVCLVVAAAAALLAVAQFVEYRAVEVGQPGYLDLPGAATAPRVAGENPTAAHSFALLAAALLAAGLGVLALARPARRAGLGRVVLALGAGSLAVILLVDLPAGLDESAEAARFAGAGAVLEDGFYAQLAAATGLILGGLLLVAAPKAAARYYARPCRTRTNSFARAASALRRRLRRRASSRGRATRSGSPRRSAAVSAPASRR